MHYMLDEFSNVPIYEQIVQMITKKIASGEFQADESLLSARQLAELLDINIHTVNKAYKKLISDGLVVMTRKRGVVVHPNLPKLRLEENDLMLKDLRELVTRATAFGIDYKEFTETAVQFFKELEKGKGA